MTEPIHEEVLGNDLIFRMILVEGGRFMMGSDSEEAIISEKPIHEVYLSDFYIGQYVVTQEIWKAVMDNNSSHHKGNNRPVTNASWNDTKEFIEILNSREGQNYRLPTEAEWEYSARGGIKNKGFVYSGSNDINEVAWYDENSKHQTHEVGLKLPNEIGLYDMNGNVWEWCEDDWHGTYRNAPADGSAWIDSPRDADHVIRGGSCFSAASDCRPTSRYRTASVRHGVSFRLVLPLQSAG